MQPLRRSAKDQECQIRIPEICNGDPATVVLCHLSGGGMGGKALDIHGAYGCVTCHDEVDRRTRKIESVMAHLYHLEGVIRTQKIMVQDRLILF